jgi:vitellogenic carboxypeptidase-like protein
MPQFYLCVGESFAGHYIPALGYYILQETAAGSISPSFQLKGIAIGNGNTDPIIQIPVYPAAAHYMCLIDWEQKEDLDTFADLVVAAIKEGNYSAAYQGRANLMEAIRTMTKLATFEDIRRSIDYYEYPNGSDWITPVLNRPSIQEALGVQGNLEWVDCTDYVVRSFVNQTMRSTKHMVEEVVTHLPVLLYQGQFDLQDGVASSEAWMRHLNWTEAKKFWSSPRKVWSIDGITAGYIRTHETLAHVVIAGAGHLAPADQAFRSQKMLEAWIGGFLGSLGDSTGSIRFPSI